MASETKDGRKVEFGIFDWIERDENSPAKVFEDRLKLLEYADKQDFFCYHMAEHHTTPLSVAPSPGIFLSAAAQRTSRIRLGPLVFLLPLYNPLRLIQEVCMLDHLSHGRLEAEASCHTRWRASGSIPRRDRPCSQRPLKCC
jgi:hypothetical protein